MSKLTNRSAGYGECTLDDLAKEMGISRERVRQIEEAAIKKLRLICAEKHIEFRDYGLSSNDKNSLANGAYIPQSGEKLPHSLPPRVHGFEPIKLPPFPLEKK